MVGLRDPVGTCNEILALTQEHIRSASPRGKMIGEAVTRFLDELPITHLPSGVDAMRLLERIAMKGVKFPAPLIMLSKVVFTLDGVLADIGGSDAGMGFSISRHIAEHWLRHRNAFRLPLRSRDVITLQCSALLYTPRLWLKCEQGILNRLLPAGATTPLAPA
jgi:hypothetical protein